LAISTEEIEASFYKNADVGGELCRYCSNISLMQVNRRRASSDAQVDYFNEN